MPRDKEDKEMQEESLPNTITGRVSDKEMKNVLQRVANYILNCTHHICNDNEKIYTITLNKEAKISVSCLEYDQVNDINVATNKIVTLPARTAQKVNLTILKELVTKMIQEGPTSLRQDVNDWSGNFKKIGRDGDKDLFEKNPLKITITDIQAKEGSILSFAQGVPSL